MDKIGDASSGGLTARRCLRSLPVVLQEGADENVRATLEQFPDQSFETPADVSQALGTRE